MEILRRYYTACVDYKRGKAGEEPVRKLEMVMQQAGVTPEICPAVSAALLKAETTGGPAGAMVLPDGRVVTREGKDVTAEYRSGAEQALALARKQGCVLAVLKERSPSCGRGRIYDGTFSRTLIPGSGVAAQLLEENRIPVYGESQLEVLLDQM